MNVFTELRPRIDAFMVTREHVMSTASLPQNDGGMSFGNPPFAIDDGTNYYAVIDQDGEVSPLPFGYQVPNEDMETDGVDVIFSKLMVNMVSGADVIRFVPLVEDFEVPGERAFCLESVDDSDVWESVGKIADAFQQWVNDKAKFNFEQRLSNALVSIYAGYEGLESVDQAISALSLDSSVLPTLFLRSYQHALDTIEEEMSAEEDE